MAIDSSKTSGCCVVICGQIVGDQANVLEMPMPISPVIAAIPPRKLNSYSGWAAAAIGFSLGNDLLIVTGALCRLLRRDPFL